MKGIMVESLTKKIEIRLSKRDKEDVLDFLRSISAGVKGKYEDVYLGYFLREVRTLDKGEVYVWEVEAPTDYIPYTKLYTLEIFFKEDESGKDLKQCVEESGEFLIKCAYNVGGLELGNWGNVVGYKEGEDYDEIRY